MLQTLEGFLEAPFGKKEPKQNDYEKKYQALKSRKRIHMEACTEVDGTYLVHIKVGSDTNANTFYDVILHFFTDDNSVKKDVSFRRYYVKFFSNSPSFIYTYATLYKMNGIMVDALVDKLDAVYGDKLPEKSNPDLKVSFDKSIYAACRFMQDHKVSAYSKVGFLARRKKKIDKFFADVASFEDVKFKTELSKIGRTVEKEAAKVPKNQKEDVKKKPHPATPSTHPAPKAKRVVAKKVQSGQRSSIRPVKHVPRKTSGNRLRKK